MTSLSFLIEIYFLQCEIFSLINLNYKNYIIYAPWIWLDEYIFEIVVFTLLCSYFIYFSCLIRQNFDKFIVCKTFLLSSFLITLKVFTQNVYGWNHSFSSFYLQYFSSNVEILIYHFRGDLHKMFRSSSSVLFFILQN